MIVEISRLRSLTPEPGVLSVNACFHYLTPKSVLYLCPVSVPHAQRDILVGVDTADGRVY